MELEDCWVFGLLGFGGELRTQGVDLEAVKTELLTEEEDFGDDCALLGLKQEGEEGIVVGLEPLFVWGWG